MLTVIRCDNISPALVWCCLREPPSIDPPSALQPAHHPRIPGHKRDAEPQFKLRDDKEPSKRALDGRSRLGAAPISLAVGISTTGHELVFHCLKGTKILS
jgi:hypothetical protein